MPEPATPLMQQYSSIKKKFPHALLFFRLGDFYELFFEDAVLASRELQITLTSRNKEKGVPVPMCGVPHHAAETYLARLIQKGYKVAICEQMEDPRLAKKIVRREVTRVITPGTAVGPGLISPGDNNYLVAVSPGQDRMGLACVDLSTGEFRATEFQGQDRESKCVEEIQHLSARELLFPSGQKFLLGPGGQLPFDNGEPGSLRLTRTLLDDWSFAYDYALRLLTTHFHVHSLDGFGLAGSDQAVCAAGALLHYLNETQQGSLVHLDCIAYYERRQWMMLDLVTTRNLELVEPVFAGAPEATLIASIDHTKTSMGARLLKSWTLRPSLDRGTIEARWDAVGELVQQVMQRERMVRELGAIQDLERLLGRVALGTASPRDLGGLRNSLMPLPELRRQIGEAKAARFRGLWDHLDELSDLREVLERALVDSPPLGTADGGIIREGYHAELDELRQLSRTGKQTIAQMEARERQATGIGSLKIKFNDVFGYYIEVSKPNLPLVPERYERKQTLVNAERFTTPELKEYERKVLDAEDRRQQIELSLFQELRTTVGTHAARIRRTAAIVAELDVLSNFAGIASARGYCRPVNSDDGVLEIRAGRHPVLEQLAESLDGERFVPNDLYMNAESERILIITGPNMGGKSTYLRQAALISILAQMGSFVPAASARLPLLDRIYTRIGASDNLARGRSTFMVEMTETAVILNTAGPRSLVILDEIGRGTATFDGLSIAWAVVEYLHSHPGIKALFATHYHELTELADHLTSVKNCHVSVKESDGNIIFLRRVEPGRADRSYGIEVARLAGLPGEVIERAREVLSQHEQSEHHVSDTLTDDQGTNTKAPGNFQLTLFTPAEYALRERLAKINIEELKPLDALNLLSELKKQFEPE